MAEAPRIEDVRDALMRALAAIGDDPDRRAALLADPRGVLSAEGVQIPDEGDVEAAVGPDNRIFVGIPIPAAAGGDVEAPGPLHARPHHADCA